MKGMQIGAVMAIFAVFGTLGLFGAAAIAIQCTDSRMVRANAAKLLSPSELKTLRSANGLCSDTYIFIRKGKKMCISAGMETAGSCG
ncbi:hypothetical protein [Dyella thiooxydans]|uniref:hypothetical protein n=1 Tax=Dyella thiooxydans TaxID=445710 RepID=UPI0012FB49E2|nr:hypothetical protein [Dyella thiooxydans]